jgi:hypothetical protein
MPPLFNTAPGAARRRSARSLFGSLLVAALIAAVPTPALALPSLTPQPTAGGDGKVWAIAQVGGTIYVGGEFTIFGGEPRNHLAAIDAGTGALTSWDPDADGTVHALTVGGDGSIVAGGKFSSVGGLTRKNLVKLDGDTGAVSTTWTPKATQGLVRALAFGNGRVYLGGTFEKVNATARSRLAALDASSGALVDWNPGADDIVRTLDVGSDGAVYAGGYFDVIGGALRPNVAQLDPATGAAAAFDAAVDYPVVALSVVGSNVYLAGAGGGGTVGAHDALTGTVLWAVRTDGDVQGIDASATTVYAGGHFDKIRDGDATPRRHLAAFDAATGALEAWDPRPNGPYGVGPTVVRDDALLIGGGFTKVNGVDQPKFARLPGTP